MLVVGASFFSWTRSSEAGQDAARAAQLYSPPPANTLLFPPALGFRGGKSPLLFNKLGALMVMFLLWQQPQSLVVALPRTRGRSVLAEDPRAGTCRGGEGARRAAGPSSPCSFQQEEESSTVILNAIIF